MKESSYIIGLDFGSESARGVLIESVSGQIIDSHSSPYRHGVITGALPSGPALSRGFVLQDAMDYVESMEAILDRLARDRIVDSIGVGFTASSPLPVDHHGQPLSQQLPEHPHAYVKLYKHSAAQRYADAINHAGGSFLDHFGGKLSGEWMLPKAAQIEHEAPDVWDVTHRFIESGDWIVWQLTGAEVRSQSFAAFKAQYSVEQGYPEGVVRGLESRLSPPLPVGSSAGQLTDAWQRRCGCLSQPFVSVAVIDSHVVLPAIGAVHSGCVVGALGTSAAFLSLSDHYKPLPVGLEGAAADGSVRGLWCYEAGQASFGDTLEWFVETFPKANDLEANFQVYNEAAAHIGPGDNHLLGLDWWSGNRVPHAHSGLSGLLLGMTRQTTAVDIYRALLEALCFGTRSIVDIFGDGGLPTDRILMTSGLARRNPLLLQILTDVLGRPVEVPDIEHATSVGAAIHGAIAAGVVANFAEGAARYGASRFIEFTPQQQNTAMYETLYREYLALQGDANIIQAMNTLNSDIA